MEVPQPEIIGAKTVCTGRARYSFSLFSEIQRNENIQKFQNNFFIHMNDSKTIIYFCVLLCVCVIFMCFSMLFLKSVY